ncbi:MAG: hypothetical protein LBP89_03400 [Helicobacteraceae bacterium]|nr:hypothetical protein [Helicobacteraceae bacterium]
MTALMEWVCCKKVVFYALDSKVAFYLAFYSFSKARKGDRRVNAAP